jgi:hydroxyacylglutathione hydrolase
MLNVLLRKVGDYRTNTLLVWCEQTKKAALFDPGYEAEATLEEIRKRNLELIYLINTHGHLDHIAENHIVKNQYKVPLLIHALDRPMLTDPVRNLSVYTDEQVISPDADATIAEGDEIHIGLEILKAIHVPGHSQGSLAFYQPGILIAGDTLFNGSVGRTDLPGGSENALIESIRNKLYILPEETVVYPGHGETTTIGNEQRTNPFIRL